MNKREKFFPSYYVEAKLGVKSNLFLGPVQWKRAAVVEEDWGHVGKSVQRLMNVGSIKINSLSVCHSSPFPLSVSSCF